MLSQKHNAEHAWRIGTLASSTARAGTFYEMIRQITRSTSSPFLISSPSRTFTSGRAGHTVTVTGRRVIKNTTLHVFEDNEAVIKVIVKGRSPTTRHVSRTHRVALDWLFDRSNLDSKIQIRYIDTKNQLADILTKVNFTRDEWNHLLNLFIISHFRSTACTAAMAKRAQQGSGEERVTAKSRPMRNLTARMPSVVSSTSSNPVRTSYGYQDPGKSVSSDDRSGKPEKPSPPGYSKEDYGRSWSSQEWKSGAAEHDRSGTLEKTSWDILQKDASHREEPLLGGNARSARYGEMIHDGSGQPETGSPRRGKFRKFRDGQ